MPEPGVQNNSERPRPLDWRACIIERLAHSEPRHAVEDWLIPGLTAEQSRANRAFFPQAPIAAAVLVPLVERPQELTVLLTQRASQLPNHAGQISFPGGRIEPEDDGPRAAALREAHEEIGLTERYVSVVGYLPDHILLSGFRVTPVVALVQPGFELLLDTQEVEDTFEVPLSHIFEPANHRSRRRRYGATLDLEVWDIQYQGHNIWGATAGMLLNLYQICTMARPAANV
ncbi:MAG: CoA pyrophosphatase [Sinobacteraceae bacterium]|nr:CoA pyrophosphatase [Nevskiaceae bacterium]